MPENDQGQEPLPLPPAEPPPSTPAPEAPGPPFDKLKALSQVEGQPESRTVAAAKEAAGVVAAASQDALRAIELLVTDPVGRLGEACASLGDQRAMAAGIVFGAVFELCYLLWPSTFLGLSLGEPTGVRRILVPLAAGALLFLGLALGSLVVRTIFGGAGPSASLRALSERSESKGSFRRDLFVAGVTLLPMAALIIFQKLSWESPLACALAYPFALSFTVLLLYSACTEMHKLSRRAASLAVPVILLVATGLAAMAAKVFGTGGA